MSAELRLVTFPLGHPVRIAAASAAMLALLALALLALMSNGSTQATLMQQLQRPAVLPGTSVGPHAVSITLPAGAYQMHLAVTPNRAGARNTVSVELDRRGVPITGAHVAVVYSMPAMAMTDALSSTLSAAGGARYAIREPVLGMPGSWTMRFIVRPAGARPFSVTVNDLLR